MLPPLVVARLSQALRWFGEEGESGAGEGPAGLYLSRSWAFPSEASPTPLATGFRLGPGLDDGWTQRSGSGSAPAARDWFCGNTAPKESF